mmetsp:Transcript_17346/g.28814  ORF Transcript_17346/g.28814 Transcript_17346/m.28814 type:complete len:197 (+) Transcript_17346:133-723(+)|eukprot:CAMPEP_0119003880 /NCGR_PEP_ID=MMETSP1176-20130426/820_1 /TAXON_ID=265551 /ORGANISM="Synedropsis recta cf, Strain CCMP1620" /LENGTH=196 /DNA_ID=CAMNT_0006955521 /DNA_START=100 /DNA_END=690 /DNA_ORIENTATION=+
MTLRSLLAGMFGVLSSANQCLPPCIPGDESIMSKKEHGTSHVPAQSNLRWGCDHKLADRICNYNRHYAEHAGYFQQETSFLADTQDTVSTDSPMEFFDTNTGKLLFTAPKGRSYTDFVKESKNHGWPSFRDTEVNWDYVRVLPNGETVSVDGTHLGHNLPDRTGNRYCINLVSVAGNPVEGAESGEEEEAGQRELR